MKKIRFTFFAILTYLFTAIVLFSCCDKTTWKLTGEEGSLTVTPLCDDILELDCNISGSFGISFRAGLEVVAEANTQIITSAYGTSCEFEYANEVDESTVSLVFSENFNNASGQVVKGSNLNGVEHIDVKVGEEGVTFFFNEDFFDEFEIESDTVQVEFSGMTDDQLGLSASTEIIFEL